MVDAHDRRFVLAASSGDLPCPNVLVHVARLAADERLINFDLTAEFAARFVILA
jgi:hypothetical protein